MTTFIDNFDGGKYRFLSNFYPCLFTWSYEEPGLARFDAMALTVEHAFQASKATSLRDWSAVMNATSPGRAKRMGRSIPLRPDWEEAKWEVMAKALRLKFQAPDLRDKLLGTGNAQLVEGNTWHDNVWGVCYCGRCDDKDGQNHLGLYLMGLREEIRKEGNG